MTIEDHATPISIVLFASQPFTTKLIASNLRNYRYSWIWLKNNKTGNLFAHYQPLRCYEDICVFAFKKTEPLIYNPQGIQPCTIIQKEGRREGDYVYGAVKEKTYVQYFTNYPCNVLKFNRDSNAVHPTQKPVALCEYLIRTYTFKGMTVLDNCAGSGTTGVACMNIGRKFIGIELNKKYFDIASKRIAEAYHRRTDRVLDEQKELSNLAPAV